MSQPSPIPATPACAALEPLLPLAVPGLPDDLLDEPQAAAVREHLANCVHCERELARHTRLDDALRQAFAVRSEAAPPLAPAQLAALMADDAPPVRPASRGPRAAWRPRLPVLAGLPAAAAVLLIALFAGYLFHLGGRGITGTPTATATFHLPPDTFLTSLAPVSAAEWWAAGYEWNPAYGVPGSVVHVTPGTRYVDPILVHYRNGQFSLAPLPSEVVGRAYGVELTGVTMISSTEGWAIGNTMLPPNADGWTSSVLLRYSNGQWTQANPLKDGWLDAITMRTSSDGWIAGRDNSGNALVFHYDGAAWMQVTDPVLTQLYIRRIATPAPNDVWMVGNHTDAATPAAIVHFDGAHWTVESGPYPNAVIVHIAMTSPDEGWALADTPTEDIPSIPTTIPAIARVLHYHNGIWEQQASFTQPNGAPHFDLIGVAMRSASDGWAMGSQGTLIHYTGGQWRQVPSPTTRELLAVILVGASDGWAVGDSVILHLTGGRWTVAAISANQ